jgi:hypothetical protein
LQSLYLTVVAHQASMVKSVRQVAGGREKAVISRFSGSKSEKKGAQRQLLLPSRVSRVRVPSPAPGKFRGHEKWDFPLVEERARSSVAERPAHNRLVAGSNPAGPISQQTR